jgi:twitching motility protein PilT
MTPRGIPKEVALGDVSIDDLVHEAVEQRASDLHLKVGSPPCLRVDGHLKALDAYAALLPSDTERLAYQVMPASRAEEFSETNETDFAYSTRGVGRFRVNVFRQRGSVGLVLRRVFPGAPGFDSLGLPGAVRRLAEEVCGLVLVTGPAGSGKTTTVAAMIDHINSSRRCSIVTIEDPIEVLHQDKLSLINQREVGSDTEGYRSALKRIMRQDPDVIFIDEIVDAETIWSALAAAGTGHLVLTTLRTSDATETIQQIVDFFPPHQHKQIRFSLASCLRGIVSQRLLERADGEGRVPAVEVLVGTGRVFDRIVEPDETHLIPDVIADGDHHGMQTFDQSLFQLYKEGSVSLRDAIAAASNPQGFRLMLSQAGLMAHNAVGVGG